MEWVDKLDNGKTGRGILFVISSVSGGGKTTVINRLLKGVDSLGMTISHTTRDPRKGEVDGKNYYFVSHDVFENMIRQDAFLEWANVYDHCYGTSRQAVDAVLSDERDAVLDIDVQGALQIKVRRPDAVLIFLVPPSMQEQERRLRVRGTESDDEVARRLEAAREELALVPEYDYAVRNDEIDSTVNTVKSIIVSLRCRTGRGLGGK